MRGLMSPATIDTIEAMLTERLQLESPRFLLEPAGAKISGSIISPTFRSMPDSQRQRLLWDALDAEYSPDSVQRVGSLLAFTPDEWDIDSE